MRIAQTRQELKEALAELRAGGRTIALVPTMGALHAGHMALVAEAAKHADHVVVYIFPNPKQFAPHEDFDRYPRPFAQDCAMLRAAKVPLLYAPCVEDVYPPGFSTVVSVKGVSESMEGTHRPHFFDGVATVLAKMFIRLMPEVVVLGEKDFQQLAVVRRLVADLDLPIRVLGLPTIRAPRAAAGEAGSAQTKLALSSRNAYLSADELEIAPVLCDTLMAAAAEIRAGGDVQAILDAAKTQLLRAGFSRVDYLELRGASLLEPLSEYQPHARLFAAVWLGKTRLIDNIEV